MKTLEAIFGLKAVEAEEASKTRRSIHKGQLLAIRCPWKYREKGTGDALKRNEDTPYIPVIPRF